MRNAGVVAAGHELTARTADMVLREGGNAFDAILAGMCTTCVAEPVLSSLGGGGFLLARPAGGKPRVYDFFVHTPRTKQAGGEPDFRPILADFGTASQEFHIGLASIATPGAVKGLFDIHRDLGYMPMRDLTAPAIGHAREGVKLDALQAYIFRVVGPIYTATPAALAIFESPSQEGRLIREGEQLRQRELADTLEVLAIEGDDLFYRGEIARTIADRCLAGGGFLTAADLEGYEVIRREPLTVSYRGVEVSTNPPPSSGGILIAFALQLLEAVERLNEFPFGSRAHLDLIAQVLDRTDQARIETRLDEGAVCPDAQRLGDEELLERYRDEVRGRAAALRGTTHLSVIDAAGNLASLSLSNGEGCGDIVPGTGIMLNNMLGEEDLNPHGFHNWRADQRMTSMMSPSMLLFPDGRTVATGSGGSKRIRAAILQVLVNLIDHGMDVERAVASPRVFFENGMLSVEPGFRTEEVERLLEDYPRHEVWDDLNLFFGGTHTVEDRRDGFHGAGDPRRGGVCIVAG